MKNRKMLSVVVAAFMVVVMAGTAFAFGTGTLEFTGTASVDVELNVIISNTLVPALAVLDPDQKSATITIPTVNVPITTTPMHFDFLLENVGNLPALVTVGFTYDEDNSSENWSDFIRINYDVAPQTIAVDQWGAYTFNVVFYFDGFTGTIVDEYVTFTIALEYAWAQ